VSRPSLTLLRCGKCRSRYSFRHVCVTAKAGKRRVRFAPSVSVKCGRCGQRYANPLTHTCTIRTDYRKRLAAAKRKAAAARKAERRRERRARQAARRKAAARAREAARRARAEARAAAPKQPRPPRHEPRSCRDPECTRYGCLHYRDGFADGQDACQRPHEGRALCTPS
jgi:hypothetical protein